MPRKHTSPPTSSAGGFPALAEALSLVAWFYLIGKLFLQHAEQYAAQDLLDRAQLFHAAARAARDLAFEMAAFEELAPVGGYEENDFLCRENLKPLYESLKTACAKAFRPSDSVFVNTFMDSRFALRTRRADGCTTTVTQVTINASVIWKFGLWLRQSADCMEVYIGLTSVGNSRKLRSGKKGKLPDMALHHLVSALISYGIGFREAACKIARLGVELDAPLWTVQARDPDAIDPDEVRRIEDRLKKVARRSRDRARGNRGTNPP